ncbi:MAG: Hpt domain-containing protein [Propionibacteriaceae bacterium]
MERFVVDYLSLLDARLDTLDQLLLSSDADATRLCILSLESSSAMLGADEMVGAARALRHAVTGSRHELERPLFAALRACADQLRERLDGLGFVKPSAAG